MSAALPADENEEGRDQERVEQIYGRICYLHAINLLWFVFFPDHFIVTVTLRAREAFDDCQRTF